MATQIHPARGMRDFLPDAKRRREDVLAVIRSVYARHGFTEIETPALEDLSRLTSGMGGDNEKLAFRVLRRGLTQERIEAAARSRNELDLADLGLRYDLTVPLARFYATNHASLPSVFRSLQIGPVWRAERPQKGRFRQFVQADIDIVGEASALAEVELIAATSSALVELGLGACVIRINDRRVLEAVLSDAGVAADAIPRVLVSVDKLDKIGVEGVTAELGEIIAADQVARIGAFLERAAAAGDAPVTAAGITGVLGTVAADDAVRNLTGIASALAAAGAPASLVFDATLVRGMGYYTSTIFEIRHPASSSSVGGGGRYDGMIGRFLGTDVPAVGFSIGFERIIDLVERDWRGRGRALAIIIPVGASVADAARLKAEALGWADVTRVELVREPRKLGRVLDELAGRGFTEFVHVRDAGAALADSEARELSGH